MRITFEDGSFLELESHEDGSIRVILCGIKSYNQATMSTADLSPEQVSELFMFLADLEQEKEEHFT